jgi:hypothetical protein
MPAARSTKCIVLGLLSFAPLVSTGVVAVTWLISVIHITQQLASFEPEPSGFGISFGLSAFLLIAGAIASVAAFVALLVDVFTNPNVGVGDRLPWIIVLVFGNVVTFPVYWYVVWWREPALSDAR